MAGIAFDSRGDIVIGGEHDGRLQLRAPASNRKRVYVTNGFVAWLEGANGKQRTAFRYVGDPLTLPADLVITPGDDVLLGGTEGTNVSLNHYDGLAVFFGRDGRERQRLHAGQTGVYGGSVAHGPDSSVLLAGALYSDPGYSGFLLSFSEPGVTRWQLDLGGMEDPRIAVDSSGALLLAGAFDGRGTQIGGRELDPRGEKDVALAWLTSTGQTVRVRHFGDKAGKARLSALAVRPAARDCALAGELEGGTVDFGAGAIAHAGIATGFIASFDEQGRARFSRRLTGTSELRVEDVAVDAEGNVVVSGFVEGDLVVADQTYAGRERALFVVKLAR